MKRHKNRKDLTGEYKFGDLGQIIFLVIFIIVWTTDTFILHFSTFLSNHVSYFIRIPIGFIILLVAGYLAKEGLKIIFGEKRESAYIIKKGVFGVVRHPIYLGAILLYLGLIVFSLSLAAGVVWIIVVLFYHFIAEYEEKLLIAKFGEEYKKYMEEVPMWIPML